MAKIADVFGRVNAYILSVVLYVLGYVIQASAPNIYVSRRHILESHKLTVACPQAYAVGNAIYILGITSLFLLRKWDRIASRTSANQPDHVQKTSSSPTFPPSGTVS